MAGLVKCRSCNKNLWPGGNIKKENYEAQVYICDNCMFEIRQINNYKFEKESKEITVEKTCRFCNDKLTDENWYKSYQKTGYKICIKCYKEKYLKNPPKIATKPIIKTTPDIKVIPAQEVTCEFVQVIRPMANSKAVENPRLLLNKNCIKIMNQKLDGNQVEIFHNNADKIALKVLKIPTRNSYKICNFKSKEKIKVIWTETISKIFGNCELVFDTKLEDKLVFKKVG
jgi:hypothetical protein